MSKVITTPNQNVYDIALQEYGSIANEIVLKLIRDNSEVLESLDTRIPTGTELFIDDENIVNNEVREYLIGTTTREQIRIKTGDEPVTGEYDENNYDSNDYLTD